MESGTQAGSVSKRRLVAGWIVTVLVVLFLLFDSVTKIMKVKAVLDASAQLGYPVSTIPGIGITLLVCAVLYVIPQTAVLGAILLTGYLGGAVATSVRVSGPLFNTLFPIIFAVFVWAGIFLREPGLTALIPLRR